jgi:hypothetical protein
MEIFRLDEFVLRVLPIELDLFGAILQLPRKWMDGPSRIQAFVCETERLSFAEEGDIGI